MDTFQSSLDITFLHLSRTDAEVSSNGAYVRDVIERDLKAAGFNIANKIYAVYYDGRSTYACGGGAWPPSLPGVVAALYLLGEPPGAPPCWTNEFASPNGPPGYLEFSMLHEILHTLGFVATCAPHHTRSGHVSDSPQDLMYAGDDPWSPSVLDFGHDDYFMHGTPSCLDLAQNSFLGASGEITFIPELSPSASLAMSALGVTYALISFSRRKRRS